MEKQLELTQSQAINILIQAARIAQSKGAFTLEDAELVSTAIKVFIPPASNDETADPALNQTDNTSDDATASNV
jgi:hypothetical protein